MRDMKARGIMLADISPVPISTGGGTFKRFNKKTGKMYTDKNNKLPDKLKMCDYGSMGKLCKASLS